MIRINQLKVNIHHNSDDLKYKIIKTLRITPEQLISYEIRKQSIDARRKPELFYVYTCDVHVRKEQSIKKKLKNQRQIQFLPEEKPYQVPAPGETLMSHRPVVVGMGPAGLFCAWLLAREGYQPILIERGAPVEERTEDVEIFWKTGILKRESNVQFGEGGAGTFSDGKLNTMVHDPNGRNMEVLRIFVENGADEKILYQNKPHIGTDVLTTVVKNMRLQIQEWGGLIHFHQKVTDFLYHQDGETVRICGLKIEDQKTKETSFIDAETVVLAIGHSARDTFHMLADSPLHLEKKPFAVGVRVEHPQAMINESQYGKGYPEDLPAAPYKLTAKTESGRGVYTFCMCPGGYVVNASSEEEMIAVNGMSYSRRDGQNANSAVIVTVTPEDFPGEDVLAGMYFQQELERKAFRAGGGKIPVQLYGDFCRHQISTEFGDVIPQIKEQYIFGDVRNIFPEVVGDSLEEGIRLFDQRLHGYAREDTVLSGVESRTSSPIRIIRDEEMQSNILGIYPCGEGAGYAGGITSAAMDGLKIGEKIISQFKPYT